MIIINQWLIRAGPLRPRNAVLGSNRYPDRYPYRYPDRYPDCYPNRNQRRESTYPRLSTLIPPAPNSHLSPHNNIENHK